MFFKLQLEDFTQQKEWHTIGYNQSSIRLIVAMLL